MKQILFFLLLISGAVVGQKVVIKAGGGGLSADTAKKYIRDTATVLRGLIGTPSDLSFQSVTYASTVSKSYDPYRPNFAITLAGNIALSVTGTSSGNSGIVNITRGSGSETISFNGTVRGSTNYPTGASAVISMTYMHDQAGLSWYLNNPVITGGGGTSDSIRVAASNPLTGNAYISSTDHKLHWKQNGYWYAVKTASLDSMAESDFVYDVDAQRFFDSSGVSNTTQKSAINQLVLDLKSASVWTKFKAIYPMVGGTASAHKWNLKNPVNADTAFRLTFSGTWTHSSTGILPDGATAFADSHLIPNVSLSSGSASMGFYSRTSVAENAVDFGAEESANRFLMYLKYSDNTGYYDAYQTTDGRVSVASNTSTKLHILSRTSATRSDVYRDGTAIGNSTGSLIGIIPGTYSMYIGASNISGTASVFSTKECAFAFIGAGFSSGEVTSINTAVNTFETTLSRGL